MKNSLNQRTITAWLRKPKLLLINMAICFTFAPLLAQDIVWTFDCDNEGWNENGSSKEMVASHQAPDNLFNSGYLGLSHYDWHDGMSWVFAPAESNLNADELKHLHFSLNLSNCGTFPTENNPTKAKLVWKKDGKLSSVDFDLYAGKKIYHLDLSANANWTGEIEINRFHFPTSNINAAGYNKTTARYAFDWIALSASSNFTAPLQDKDPACKESTINLSGNIDQYVHQTSFSIRAEMLSGNYASLKLKYAKEGADWETWEYPYKVKNGNVYASISFLEAQSTYNYELVVYNSENEESITGSFNTEKTINYNLRGKHQLWFGPTGASSDLKDIFSPTSLTQWPEAAEKSQSFHVHSNWIKPSSSNSIQMDIPEMLFGLNAAKLSLSMETGGVIPLEMNRGWEVVGIASAYDIFKTLDLIYQSGGKLDYLSPDDPIKRVTPLMNTTENALTMEEALDAAVIYYKKVTEKYPNIQTGFLVNFPNWDFEYKGKYHYGSNLGNYTQKGGMTFDEILTTLNQKLITAGVKQLDFVEVDNPYSPYYIKKTDSRTPGIEYDDEAMFDALEDYCHENNMACGLIFNSSDGGGISNAQFYSETMSYLIDRANHDTLPDFLNVESWYDYPNTNLPETEAYTLMSLINAFGTARDEIVDSYQSNDIAIQEKSELFIYPNPCINTFRINTEAAAEIDIYTIHGVHVKSEQIMPGNEISLNGLKGSFIVRINTNGKTSNVLLISK